jgi:hypothetical protein
LRWPAGCLFFIGDLMPTYSFEDTKTNEQFDKILSMSERETYLKDNPHVKQIFKKAPGIGDPVRLGLRKPDDGFRDVLKNVKHHHGGSRTIKNTINDF